MNILHITPDYPSEYYIGGQGVFTREIALQQVREGHAVSAMCPIASQYYNWNRLGEFDCDQGINVIRLECNDGRRIEQGLKLFPPSLDFSALSKARKIMGQADIIHVYNFWFTGFLFPLLQELLRLNLKYVYSPFLEDYLISPHFREYATWYAILGRSCRSAAACVVWSRDEYIKLNEFTDRIYISIGGIRPEDFPPPAQRIPARTGEQNIVTVGNICERKNTAALIDAVAQLRHPFKLYVVGSYVSEEYLALCRKRVIDLNISDRVVFTGPLSKQEVLALYRTADVFVLPSLAEAFGLTIIEAMASSLPVVVSAASLAAEHIIDSHDGILFDPQHPSALADILNTLFKNPDIAGRIGRHGMEKAISTFTWDKTASLCAKAYSDVISGTTAPSTGSQITPAHLTSSVIMTEDERGLGLGWFPHKKGEPHRWTSERAFLLLDNSHHHTSLHLELGSLVPGHNQVLKIIVQGEIASTINLRKGWNWYAVALPEFAGTILRIELLLNMLTPRSYLSADDRPLGMMVRAIKCDSEKISSN